MINRPTITALAAASLLLVSSAAGQITVSEFAPEPTGVPPLGVWFESDIRGDGEAAVVSLFGEGGNLENAQPLPLGAARLITLDSNDDKAEVAVVDNYGTVGDILSSFELAYSFYKASVPDTNAAAAPSIKLTISNPNCAEGVDCFGTLVYEPNWNGPGATSPNPPSTNPTPDVWTPVQIDADNGLFWWTGGFGQSNSFGGPPIRTLNEWADVMSPDFLTASVVAVSVGVGTFNPNQVGYFDDVRISHAFGAGFDKQYDFEPVPQNKDECKQGGWQAFGFENQGLCIKSVVAAVP